MQIVVRGTHLVDIAPLWKRGDLYQVSIMRPEMVELLRAYDNRKVMVVVEGIPFKAKLKYEVPKRGSPYIRIFLPMKLNVIWSRLHETAGKVKVEVIIGDENTQARDRETPRAPSSINRAPQPRRAVRRGNPVRRGERV
jgi:hypothetical protein